MSEQITDEELETWWEQADNLQYSKMMPYSQMGRDWQKLIAEVRRLRTKCEFLIEQELANAEQDKKHLAKIEEQAKETARLTADARLMAGWVQDGGEDVWAAVDRWRKL